MFVLRDDSMNVLVCSIISPATTCTSGADTVTIAAGSNLALLHLPGGAIDDSPTALYSWRATTP